MKFFRNVYVAIYRWYTFLLIGMATHAVQKLMVMIGKNPNYVPPAPQPYVPPNYNDMDINRAWMVDHKNRSNIWLVVDGYYVHHPEAHPILKLRTKWEEKLKAALEKLMANKVATAQSVVEESVTAPTMKEILAEADKPRWEEAQKSVAAVAQKVVADPEKKA